MEKLGEVLAELAKQLGTTIPYLWGVLVKQAYISAIQDVVTNVMITFVTIFTWRFFGKRKDNLDYFDVEFAKVGLVLVTALMLVWFMVNVNSIITALFNPEYYALEKIFSKMK